MSVVSADRLRMLQAAEEALRDATYCRDECERRLARRIVSDTELFELWKADMRLLLTRAAKVRSARQKHAELRRIGTGLIHQSALIDHLRRSSPAGADRERLLARFFRGIDHETAIRHEYRRYRLASASRIALGRLLLLHGDFVGSELLTGYQAKYARYFSLYCDWLALRRGSYADIVRAAMLEARREADEWRRLTLTTRLPRHGKQRFLDRARSRLPGRPRPPRAPGPQGSVTHH